MISPELVVCADADQLAQRAAAIIGQAAAASIAQRGRFTFVLTGGSSPKQTYERLAVRAVDPAIDWSRTYLFVGDERFVPYDDERSNYGMARRELIEPAGIAGDRVFPMPTDRATPADGARAYAQTLQQFFDMPGGGPMPVFDLVLLGLGDDGHCASLFPHAPALQVNDTSVTWSPPGTLPPPVDRVTLTYPALNAARQVLFIVPGANKAEAVRDIWQNDAPPIERPAAGVRPQSGRLTWLVDKDAARLLAAR